LVTPLLINIGITLAPQAHTLGLGLFVYR